MKKIRVTLAVPNFRWSDSDENALWHYIPYNLCLLAAMVEDICDISILDAYQQNMSKAQFQVALKESNPDVVGITVLMDQYASAGHAAAELVKSINKDIRIIMGGVYATTNPKHAIEDSNIDFVVIGEGEYVFKDLLGYFAGKKPLPEKGICYRSNGEVINTGHSDFIANLDDLPLPAYHLIELEKYISSVHRKSVDSPRRYPYARIMTSRGCPCGCAFCQVESISGRKFRPRSPGNVLKEIEYLKDGYGIKSIIFDDDNLFMDKERAKNIFQGMIDRGLAMPWVAIAVAVFKLDKELIKLMKASGCEYVDIAIESGSERVLKDIIRKPVDLEYAKQMVGLLKQEGIYIAANFMIGFPTETWDEIRQTLKAAEKIDADYVKLFAVIPLRNTRLWQACEEKGAFKDGFEAAERVWSTGQMVETDEFSANDITILRAYEWDRINFSDPQKRKKTAAMMDIGEDELVRIRKRTFDNVHLTLK